MSSVLLQGKLRQKDRKQHLQDGVVASQEAAVHGCDAGSEVRDLLQAEPGLQRSQLRALRLAGS